MKRTLLSLTLFCFVVTLAHSSDFAIQEVNGKHIDVSFKDRVVFRLMTANDVSTPELAHETYKVYGHVMDPLDPDNKGTITKGAGHKFTHHRGIFIGWARAQVEGVGGVDTWHMKDGVRQHFIKTLVEDSGDDHATLSVAIAWVKGDAPLLDEERTFVIHRPTDSGALMIDAWSKVTASAGDVVLKGDPEHAGLQFRAHQDVAANKSSKYIFPNDMKPGKDGDKDIPWAAMQCKVADRSYHVQHMSHPSLPKGNIYSAYRDYGRFGAYFVKNLDKGQSSTFKARFYISPGEFPDNAVEAMDGRYKDYIGE